MSVLEITFLGFAAWRLCLVALLLSSYAFYVYRGRMQPLPASAGPVSDGAGFEYSNAPTVRLSDTQRIDRLHRIVTLKAGEHANMKDLTFGRLHQLRVLLKAIEHDGGQDMAHIELDLGGVTPNCGAAVKELKENNFLMPRATLDEQRCAVHYFCGKPDAVSFLQIKVRRLDPVEQSAAIDVLHVRGRWEGGTG